MTIQAAAGAMALLVFVFVLGYYRGKHAGRREQQGLQHLAVNVWAQESLRERVNAGRPLLTHRPVKGTTPRFH